MILSLMDSLGAWLVRSCCVLYMSHEVLELIHLVQSFDR